jgi:glycosyltransferase involved in cell wall biosynthesis
MTPQVSIVIPTYNRADTLSRSIDSALSQTYRPIEVIVVDDGSTDRTCEVLASYGGRIRHEKQANAGPSSARNRGVGMSRGEFIAFLDSDDVWHVDKISRQVRLMDGGGHVDCCITNASIIDTTEAALTTFRASDVMCGLDEGYWLNPAEIIATRFVLFNQCALIRRSAFEEVGGFNPGMRLLEDHDLAFRLALRGEWAFISDPLVIKYNDTSGIGVEAMADPLKHTMAWRSALLGFQNHISNMPGVNPRVAKHLDRAVRNVAIEISAHQMLASGPAMARLYARLRLFRLAKSQSLRRRLPGWPRVIARK